jgi:hypothetical protein
MKTLIRALAVATMLQIGATSCFTFFMIDHSSSAAREFSLQVEQRANEHTGAVVLDMYNKLEQQRNADRDEMKVFVDHQITLRLLKSNLPTGE